MTSEAALVYKWGVNVPTNNVTKVIFDASVTETPGNAFSYCTNLKEVVLNEGLQKIGNLAFFGCTSLTIIKFPSSLTNVGRGAFHNCTNLREIRLNEGLQKIRDSTFSGCTSLTVIKLPSTVIAVGPRAFGDCTNLNEVTLNEGLQEIMSGAPWELGAPHSGAFYNCTSLTIIKLPSTLTEIGESAFNGCTNLSEIVLNEGLQEIGGWAFCGCSSLEQITLPTTLNKIGRSAFRSCTNLREVVLNGGLWEIGSGAFHDCASLAMARFPAISKRAKNLIKAGQTKVEDKVTVNEHFEWRGEEFLVSPEAISNDHWAAVRTNLEQVLAWISHYELKEATTLFELALWKTRIEEMGGAVTDEERSACRGVDIPGPAKDTILQYLQQTSED